MSTLRSHLQRIAVTAVCLFAIVGAVSPPWAVAQRPASPIANSGPVPASWLATDDDQLRPARSKPPTVPGPRDGSDPFAELSEQERTYASRALENSAQGKSTLTETGGDDLTVREHPDIGIVEVAVAEDGTVFVAVGNTISGGSWAEYITVHRSTDGGNFFEFWGQVGTSSGGVQRLRDLDVTSGANARLFVTSMESGGAGFDVNVTYADPTAASPVWTTTTPLTGAVSYLNPDLDTDHQSFSSYYVYLTASGIDGNGDDIWFARSTTLGTSWDTPYRVGELTSSGNLMYSWPRISYGYGGRVHVLWTYSERLQSTIDDGVRYRAATSYGAGATDWGSTYAITSIFDGVEQQSLDVCASLLDDTVVLLHTTTWAGWEYPQYRVSTDAGSDWFTIPSRAVPWDRGGDLAYSFTDNGFVGTGIRFYDGMEQVVARAPATGTVDWTTPERFSDAEYGSLFWPVLALDPTRDERAAVAVRQEGTPRIIHFDAEWRGDPGHPNFEPGMPRVLESFPNSPPALVDLDDDGDLEIVYGTEDGLIEVRHHDGERMAGWPVVLPSLSDGPVAVGELAGGRLSVVAGTADGVVHAYNAEGGLEAGWPYDMGTAAPVYVSIGALGGPYPRTVVAGSGPQVTFLNYRGEPPLDTFGWTISAGSITTPAAIGDIDGDGISELVVAAGTWVFGLRLYDAAPVFQRNVGAHVSDAVTLGDHNQDGTVEIAVPTVVGQLHLLEGDGSDVSGWPFTTPSASRLTSAAWAQIRGTTEPELAVAALEWNVHLLYYTGVEAHGYPNVTGSGWFLLGAPVMGGIEGGSGDVMIGSRSRELWSWDNFGTTIPGWPKRLEEINHVGLSPAMGDIDLDGRNEVVVLAGPDLMIVDVGTAPMSAINTWAMYGHDAQRTGCSDCVQDVATPVPDDPEGAPTRVQFSGAFPNPVSGPTTQFRFAVPVHARASLEIYDLRGRLVQRLLRQEVASGEHVLTWNGRDGQGRSVASGPYLARLKVQGPGLDDELIRRVMVLR